MAKKTHLGKKEGGVEETQTQKLCSRAKKSGKKKTASIKAATKKHIKRHFGNERKQNKNYLIKERLRI